MSLSIIRSGFTERTPAPQLVKIVSEDLRDDSDYDSQ